MCFMKVENWWDSQEKKALGVYTREAMKYYYCKSKKFTS
jgi:hypothetical protein